MVSIFEAVDCPHLRRQYMFNEFFSCICIGFSEFTKPAMCKISHSHFFSIMLFVLPFRTERSTYFILGKVCHFVGGLKHKYLLLPSHYTIGTYCQRYRTVTFALCLHDVPLNFPKLTSKFGVLKKSQSRLRYYLGILFTAAK